MSEEPMRPQAGRDDELAQIFGRARTRERPRPAAEAGAFEALHREWIALTRARRRRRIALLGAAVAASVVLVAAYGLLRGPIAPAPVAAIERIEGADVAWRDERSLARPLTGRHGIAPGQQLITGDGSRVALAWHEGGSLRIDERSRVEFVSEQSVRVESGSVYFDSESALRPGASPARLSVQTPAGGVVHVGTQFMVTVDSADVVVSVREGQVTVTGDGFEVVVGSNEQVDVDSRGIKERRPIRSQSEAWAWVAEITPLADLDGRTAFEIVEWAARETGRRVVYGSASAQLRARGNVVRGLDSRSPGAVLNVLPHLTELQYDVRDDVIVVSSP